jgi:putative aldouronate transport system permease protein
VSFPLSILIALMINEIRLTVCKRLFQTILYLPHFLSWVIVSGLVIAALSPRRGSSTSSWVRWGETHRLPHG